MENVTSEAESLQVRARQNVVLLILALIFNFVLLIVVCVSLRLRRSAKYQLIASLSLTDVLLGVIYLPLDTSMALNDGVWKYGCNMMFFVYGLQEFAVPTITTLTLAALCLEYSITVFYNMTPFMQRHVVLLGILIPWILGCLSFLPVYLDRVVTSSGSFTSACTGKQWQFTTLFFLIGLFGFIPLVFLVAALLLMLISFCCRPTDDRLAVRTIIAHSEDVYLTHEITDTILACLISVAFNLPFLVEFVMHVKCDGFSACRSPQRVQHVLEVLRTAESVIFPAIWMLGSEFRHGLFTSCKCCYRHCDLEVEEAVHIR